MFTLPCFFAKNDLQSSNNVLVSMHCCPFLGLKNLILWVVLLPWQTWSEQNLLVPVNSFYCFYFWTRASAPGGWITFTWLKSFSCVNLLIDSLYPFIFPAIWIHLKSWKLEWHIKVYWASMYWNWTEDIILNWYHWLIAPDAEIVSYYPFIFLLLFPDIFLFSCTPLLLSTENWKATSEMIYFIRS